MASRAQKERGAKKSAFSCEPCRKRKVKCGGEHPTCLRCRDRNDVCEYKLNPTLLYTQRLERRIKELEARLGSSGGAPDAASSSPPPGIAEPDYVPAEDSSPENGSLPAVFEGLSVNQSGHISFHGPTSFLNLPLSPTGANSDEAPSHGPLLLQDMERSQGLVMNAYQQRALEIFSTTPDAFQYLLEFHWTWIQPVFNFVYRPAFTRDMNVNGPYFSHALLAAILAHSTRWRRRDAKMQEYLEPYEDGVVFARHAATLLHEDLREGKGDIPTIQTCLVLSAAESSKGNWTQAWMYSGIAFRLMEDQGINIDQAYSRSVVLSEEDIEIRKRLFWSCYFWDKVISLYSGRRPSIQRFDVSPHHIMLDDSSEEELWTPLGIHFTDGREYPPWKAHSISSFKWICKLAEVLDQLLLNVYNPLTRVTQTQLLECLESQKKPLQQWWKELPAFLRIDPANMPIYCPPSHIVTLNSLYHTVNILLHRPLLSKRSSPHTDSAAAIECMSSASAITIIFELFSTTFGYGYSIMSLSYGIYMAASIFLLQVQAVKSSDPRTLERLHFCIDSLESVSTVNVALQQALRVIRAEVDKINPSPAIAGTYPADYSSSSMTMAPESSKSFGQTLEQANSNTSDTPWSFSGQEAYGFETMEFPQGMLEALGDIEPITAYFGSERSAFVE